MMVVGPSASAWAAQPTLRDVLFGSHGEDSRRSPPPPVARYMVGDSAGFILDRSSPTVLIKFDDSSEVWALEPQTVSRGDVIYRNDAGEAVLRATRLGGLTLFTPKLPGGAAAALAGQAGSIRPPLVIPPNALFQRLKQASARASRAAQHLISFETVDDATPDTSVLIADAAYVTAEAFERIAHDGEDRSLLARIGRVLLAEGHKPNAALSGSSLVITYAPGKGVAGRPSSERIVKIIAK